MKRSVPLVLLGLGLIAACRQDITAKPCGRIPDQGCPIPVKSSCKDPTCAAVYNCNDGQWDLVATCTPIADAGIDRQAPVVTDAATYDAPPEQGGCSSLVLPDCSLTVAQACGKSCCGCEDIFVCNNGGWDAWGICGANGPEPK